VVSGRRALAGGYVCDMIDRRTAYCLFGVLIAVELVITAFLPRRRCLDRFVPALYGAGGACYAPIRRWCWK